MWSRLSRHTLGKLYPLAASKKHRSARPVPFKSRHARLSSAFSAAESDAWLTISIPGTRYKSFPSCKQAPVDHSAWKLELSQASHGNLQKSSVRPPYSHGALHKPNKPEEEHKTYPIYMEAPCLHHRHGMLHRFKCAAQSEANI